MSTKTLKPRVGSKMLATEVNMTKPEGEFMGVVKEISGNILHFEFNGKIDSIIWNFREGQNAWVRFEK